MSSHLWLSFLTRSQTTYSFSCWTFSLNQTVILCWLEAAHDHHPPCLKVNTSHSQEWNSIIYQGILSNRHGDTRTIQCWRMLSFTLCGCSDSSFIHLLFNCWKCFDDSCTMSLGWKNIINTIKLQKKFQLFQITWGTPASDAQSLWLQGAVIHWLHYDLQVLLFYCYCYTESSIFSRQVLELHCTLLWF